MHRPAMQTRLVLGCWLAVCSLAAQDVEIPLDDDSTDLGTVVIEAESEKPKAWVPSITTAGTHCIITTIIVIIIIIVIILRPLRTTGAVA